MMPTIGCSVCARKKPCRSGSNASYEDDELAIMMLHNTSSSINYSTNVRILSSSFLGQNTMLVKWLILADCNDSTSAEIREVAFASSVDDFGSVDETVSKSGASKVAEFMGEKFAALVGVVCTSSGLEV